VIGGQYSPGADTPQWIRDQLRPDADCCLPCAPPRGLLDHQRFSEPGQVLDKGPSQDVRRFGPRAGGVGAVGSAWGADALWPLPSLTAPEPYSSSRSASRRRMTGIPSTSLSGTWHRVGGRSAELAGRIARCSVQSVSWEAPLFLPAPYGGEQPGSRVQKRLTIVTTVELVRSLRPDVLQ
jgi:hypothetical protein